MTPVDPIQSSDLEAYIDDQLTASRRIEVESYLSENPDVAARVMADLAIRGELRLALSGGRNHGRADTREAARRLQSALSRGAYLRTFQRMAATVALVAAGWMLSQHYGPLTISSVQASTPAPTFVEEAMRAHDTSVLRESMPSQTGSSQYDAAEIRSATAIVMPQIPKEWKVSDVQIFPSAFGPSVEMSLTDAEQKKLSLFAVRPGFFAVQEVMQAREGEVSASYWQIGEVAYALVSERQSAPRLKDEAERLARSLY
ncbi:anti-sigma factor [Rhizobium sp. FKY42]|uniref:anti-sigma factor family protein n=1 Tax=Rhizobium sp. FKY42 TaxID=2562310 RepID=UPI0010C150C1|nr:anti-sigma factor [Rhizobium sp. FKY42]